MWILLTCGAVSVVQRPKCPKKDARTLQVRARRREWLDEFRTRYCPELGENVQLKNVDYQWRAYVTPEDMARAVARAVLSIDYGNFKNATSGPEHGLKDPALRSSLHSAYHKVWGELMVAGDGTSAYQSTWTGLKGIAACRAWGHYWPAGRKTCVDCSARNPSYPAKGPKDVYPKGYSKKKEEAKTANVTSGIEACRRWGHFWPAGSLTCQDCPERNPSFPARGPDGIFPPGYPEGKFAGKTVPQQASAKAMLGQAGLPDKSEDGYQAALEAYDTEHSEHVTFGEGDCPGSWGDFDPQTYGYGSSAGEEESAQCDYCGTRQPLSADGLAVRAHAVPDNEEVH